MTLKTILAEAIKDVRFSYRLGGVKATYLRYEKDDTSPFGANVSDSTTMWVYPLAFSAETVETIGGQGCMRFSRVDVVWVENDDLRFNGEHFLPERGDEITFRIGCDLHRYVVDTFVGDASDESQTIIQISARKETNDG